MPNLFLDTFKELQQLKIERKKPPMLKFNEYQDYLECCEDYDIANPSRELYNAKVAAKGRLNSMLGTTALKTVGFDGLELKRKKVVIEEFLSYLRLEDFLLTSRYKHLAKDINLNNQAIHEFLRSITDEELMSNKTQKIRKLFDMKFPIGMKVTKMIAKLKKVLTLEHMIETYVGMLANEPNGVGKDDLYIYTNPAALIYGGIIGDSCLCSEGVNAHVSFVYSASPHAAIATDGKWRSYIFMREEKGKRYAFVANGYPGRNIAKRLRVVETLKQRGFVFPEELEDIFYISSDSYYDMIHFKSLYTQGNIVSKTKVNLESIDFPYCAVTGEELIGEVVNIRWCEECQRYIHLDSYNQDPEICNDCLEDQYHFCEKLNIYHHVGFDGEEMLDEYKRECIDCNNKKCCYYDLYANKKQCSHCKEMYEEDEVKVLPYYGKDVIEETFFICDDCIENSSLKFGYCLKENRLLTFGADCLVCCHKECRNRVAALRTATKILVKHDEIAAKELVIKGEEVIEKYFKNTPLPDSRFEAFLKVQDEVKELVKQEFNLKEG